MMVRSAALLPLALSFLLPASALSAPVVADGDGEAAALKWQKSGRRLLLTIKPEYDAEQIAQTIKEAHPQLKVSTSGNHLKVSGQDHQSLLKLLKAIDVEPAIDDIDAILANIRQGDPSDSESGTSVRARKSANFGDLLGPAEGILVGKVIKVNRQRFPLVFIRLEITQGPKAGVGGVKPGATITILPRVKSRNGLVDPNDRASQLNVGAWYAREGDSFRLRLEDKPSRKVFVAAALERLE